MKKKLLLILTVLIVVMMGLTVVACTDYNSPSSEDDAAETVTRTQLITNGTFYNATGSTADAYVKTTVSGWTATKGSLGTTSNGVTMGVIDLANTESYNLNKDKFSVADHTSFNNPGVDPKTPFDTDDEGEETTEKQDTNALVIASNETAGSVYYKNSSSYTLEAGKYYLLQYSVCTVIDLTDVAEEDQAKKGAWVHLTGAVEYLNPCINTNGEWKTYYVYIEANKTTTATIDLRLWLGNGPEKINDVANVYATRGAAMFDNFICTEVTEASDPTYNEGAVTELDHDSFALMAANAETKYGYVSTYYLSDLGLTQLNETYYTPTTTNAIKYYYSFREGSYTSSNTKNYNLVVGKNDVETTDKPSVTNAFTGVVDLSKLYGSDENKDAYSALLGSTYTFGAPSYADWTDKIMNGTRGDLNDLAETKALMLYYNDLSAAGLVNKSSFTVEKDKNYIVSVWVYVWAPYDDVENKFVYPTANAPTKPSDYTEAQAALRDYFNDYTDVGELFEGYFEALTEQEQTTVDGDAPASVTAADTITALISTDTFLNALNAQYNANVATSFKYKFLKEHFDEYVTSGDLDEGDEDYVEYQALKERSNFLKNTWPAVKTLMEKWEKYDDDYLTYMSKYTVWSDNNDKPYAKVKLSGAGDDLVETSETFNTGWEQVTFYITGNQLSSRSLTLEMWFGEGTKTEYENLMFGGVFFDNVSIVEISDEVKAATYADKDWKVLSPLTDENELTFGGLAYPDGEQAPVIEDHWTNELAENVAQEDKDSIVFEYVDNTSIGSVDLGTDTYLLKELVIDHTVPTASIVKGLDVMTVKKNTAYRLALWVKTAMDKDASGISVELVGGSEDTIDKMSVLSSVTGFKSDEWQEIVFYIMGDSQVTNYVALQLTIGSGTRYSTESYLEGEVHVAVMNCKEIKYSEYNASSKSGDQVKTYSFANTATASDSVTNGNFSSIDYSKTSVDEFAVDGGLKEGGVASVTGWTQATAIGNTFNTITLSSDRVGGTDTYKISWAPVVGIDYNGNETVVSVYEVYAKFIDDGEVVERLYKVITADTSDATVYEEDKYFFTVDLTGIKATSFRVRAISDTAVSSYSDYVTPASATADGNILVAKADEIGGKKEVKAGAVNNEGLFAGSDYVSPYKTSLVITSNYAVAQKMTATDKSLSANSYYYVSVWVKTVGDAKASITVGNVSKVLTAERENNYIGFANVTTEGKWSNYGFYIKTGTTSTSLGLELSLGNPYAVKSSKKIGTSTTAVAVYDNAELSTGTVYFDAVRVLTVTEADFEKAEAAYNEALENEEDLWLDFDYLYDGAKNRYTYQILTCTADSFDSFTANSTSEGTDGYNLGNTPNNYTWAKASDATGTTEKERLYGVYNHSTDAAEKLKTLYTVTDAETAEETNVFADFLPAAFDVREFIRIDGYNSLVMSNKVAFGQNYTTSSAVTINANAYYKVSFKAKSIIAKEVKDGDDTTYSTEGVNAEFRYMQNGATDNYQSIYINTNGEEQTFTLYIKNPSSSSSSAKWGFFLGDNAGENDTTGAKQLLLGMLVVDQVAIETIDEDAYTAAATAFNALSDSEKLAAATKIYSYDEDKGSGEGSGEGSGDDTDTTPAKTSIWDRGDAWLLISSIVIAVVIAVVVVVVVIRRWKKKHPREVIVENNVNTDKNVKKVEPEAPEAVVPEPIDDDTDEYSDVVEKPVYIQRVVRKDKKKKK